MTTRPPLYDLLTKIEKSGQAQVDVESGVLSFGFRSSTGREIAVLAEETLSPGLYRVSDAGESWSEMIIGGYADSLPSASDAGKLSLMCSMHGVDWDHRGGEIVAIVRLAEVLEASRRIVAAALALDGWRAWYPPRTEPHRQSIARILGTVVDASAEKGWSAERNSRIHGSAHVWRAGAVLSRQAGRVLVSVLPDPVAEIAVERALAWCYDVSESIVFVMQRDACDHFAEFKAFADRSTAVPRMHDETHRLILEGAERVFRGVN